MRVLISLSLSLSLFLSLSFSLMGRRASLSFDRGQGIFVFNNGLLDLFCMTNVLQGLGLLCPLDFKHPAQQSLHTWSDHLPVPRYSRQEDRHGYGVHQSLSRHLHLPVQTPRAGHDPTPHRVQGTRQDIKGHLGPPMGFLDQDRETTHEGAQQGSIDVINHIAGIPTTGHLHGQGHDFGPPGTDSIPDQCDIGRQERA